jgi:hypothetical protein
VEEAIDKDLPRCNKSRKRFDRVCNAGGDRVLLFNLLVLAADAYSGPGSSVWDLCKIPRTEFVNLSKDLESVATKIEASDRILSCYWRARYSDNKNLPETIRGALRVQLFTYQETIPGLLRNLAITVKDAEKWLTDNVGPKRYDWRRHATLNLLRYIRQTTGKPHWADVEGLLVHLICRFEGARPSRHKRKVSDPTRLTPMPTSASLKQLWRRAGDYHFLSTSG